MSFYQLADVLDADSMQSKKELSHIIGKDFEVKNLEVGKQAILNNISDSHIFRRVTKTSIIDNIKESMKEVQLIAKDSVYVLKKL